MLKGAAKQAMGKGRQLVQKGIGEAKRLAKSKSIRSAVRKNVKKVTAKAIGTAGDYASKKIDYLGRSADPEDTGEKILGSLNKIL